MNINTVRAKTNLTYTEARDQCPVTCSNGYEILSNMQDYPSLETYASAVKSNENFKQQWEKTNLPRERIAPAVKLWKPAENEKDKRRKGKRQREAGAEDGSDKETLDQKQKKSELSTGVGLNNPHRVHDTERIQSLVQEATQKAVENANRVFQEQVMKFISMIVDQNLPNEVQETFKVISNECFDLRRTIV